MLYKNGLNMIKKYLSFNVHNNQTKEINLITLLPLLLNRLEVIFSLIKINDIIHPPVILSFFLCQLNSNHIY